MRRIQRSFKLSSNPLRSKVTGLRRSPRGEEKGPSGHLWLAVSHPCFGPLPLPRCKQGPAPQGGGKAPRQPRARPLSPGRTTPPGPSPKVALPFEKFFFQIPISRVGTCCPDTRQLFPRRFEVSGRNFFSRGYDTPWTAALLRPRVRPFLWGEKPGWPQGGGQAPRKFFFPDFNFEGGDVLPQH